MLKSHLGCNECRLCAALCLSLTTALRCARPSVCSALPFWYPAVAFLRRLFLWAAPRFLYDKRGLCCTVCTTVNTVEMHGYTWPYLSNAAAWWCAVYYCTTVCRLEWHRSIPSATPGNIYKWRWSYSDGQLLVVLSVSQGAHGVWLCTAGVHVSNVFDALKLQCAPADTKSPNKNLRLNITKA